MGESFEVHAELDPATIHQLGLLYGGASFRAHVQEALQRSVVLFEATAIGYMWDHFHNPGGNLEDGFISGYLNWDQVYLDNLEPYARRRNWGFSGQVDALGRYYPDDPGIAWAENTIEIITPGVQSIVAEEMEAALSGA